jgi:diaminohydroxyphosphoribosylaminopyrimidine deaminase/5-amino-6-(5-phosphoribosylamino)uracil reductase
MVGSGTVVLDDPELIVHDLPGARNPMRAIIDTRLLTSPTRQVCQHDDFLTWIFASQEAVDKYSPSFPKSVSLVATPVEKGHVDLNAVLNLLGADGVRTILCEGGAGLGGALLEQRLVDEVHWFLAPKLLVDSQAKSALTGSKDVPLPDAVNFISHTYKEVGPDLLIHALIHEP